MAEICMWLWIGKKKSTNMLLTFLQSFKVNVFLRNSNYFSVCAGSLLFPYIRILIQYAYAGFNFFLSIKRQNLIAQKKPCLCCHQKFICKTIRETRNLYLFGWGIFCVLFVFVFCFVGLFGVFFTYFVYLQGTFLGIFLHSII